MSLAADRPEFAPPSQPGVLRAFVLAVIAHVLLLLALTWGIDWKRSSEDLAAEAELWSSVPQQAAPKEVQAPPPPPPAPKVQEPPPKPVPTQREADIALEREKKRQAEAREKDRQEELERQKKLAAQKKQEELKKQEQQRLAAENRKKEEAAKQKKQQEEESRKLAQLREENLRRIQGLAGASGGPTATGNAQRSSGPSASYAGRIRARVKPNIVFTDDAPGNPQAEVEVRMAPDGTIIGRRLIKPSGLPAWDEAVLRALDRTEVLPRDVDGRVPSPIIIAFRPKD
jgi:colicin import membrane protein